ncbi:MAG: T9SS type A sorting domain-containing protein [Ignavibacteriaceae bacterium]|nr:T9SS type A sorting domain-containing protein [Ignavibacteriaceae bacterium]
MIRTSDGGLSWDFESIGVLGIAWDLDFRNGNEAWSPLGFELIYSLDAGSTWTSIPTPDSSLIFDIIFPDSLHGFAVGREGAIIKYNPPIINFVEKIDEDIPERFYLFQNYPNPFNPSTTISYSIPSEGYVTLKVYDVLGNEVASLVDEQKHSGTFDVHYNASALSSGIYYYRLVTSEFTSTKKLILMK